MRIYATLLCVVVLLGMASAGYCQWWWMGTMTAATTARWAGMGGAGIAAANDAAAIDFNPANLPNMELDGVDMGRPLAWGGTATYGDGDIYDMSVKIGAHSSGGKWGAGFSYERLKQTTWYSNIWGLGYGAVCGPGWSWGVSATRDEWKWGTATWINGGVACNIPQVAAPPIRVGLIVSNILEHDNDPRFYNLGVAVPVGENLLLAADAWDITDEWERFFNFGAEFGVARDYCVRAGRLDEDWTVGGGYREDRFSLDAAFVKRQDDWRDDQWLVSGSMPF
jgi:hypothetical protein